MDDAPVKVLQQLLDPSPVPDVRTFNDKVSPELSAVLSRMCAKSQEERLASPKAVVDALVRLGYAAPSSGGTEFATEEDAASDGMVQDLIPDIVAAPRAGEDLVLETQDKDMQEFMARLRRKRMRRRIAWAIGAVLLILTAALVWRILT
jgi:hypothetical protein